MNKDISDKKKAPQKEAEKKLSRAVKAAMIFFVLLLLWVVGRGLIKLSSLASSIM